jgi:Mn2+/Fe2+ NRAMP family transporter
MRATVAYTTARILLFVAAVLLLYLAGARGLLLLGLALLVSGIASYVVLSRQRDRMAGALSGRFRSLRRRLDEGTKAEDDDTAAAGGERPADTATPRS